MPERTADTGASFILCLMFFAARHSRTNQPTRLHAGNGCMAVTFLLQRAASAI